MRSRPAVRARSTVSSSPPGADRPPLTDVAAWRECGRAAGRSAPFATARRGLSSSKPLNRRRSPWPQLGPRPIGDRPPPLLLTRPAAAVPPELERGTLSMPRHNPPFRADVVGQLVAYCRSKGSPREPGKGRDQRFYKFLEGAHARYAENVHPEAGGLAFPTGTGCVNYERISRPRSHLRRSCKDVSPGSHAAVAICSSTTPVGLFVFAVELKRARGARGSRPIIWRTTTPSRSAKRSKTSPPTC
jgi:hypothetical protein